MKTRKNYKIFDTSSLTHDIKGKSIRGGSSLLAGQGASIILRIGTTAILARLLMPEQFGLVYMVTAFTGFAQIFKDLGLSDATIQKKDITHDEVSNLFWINASLGILTMIFIASMSSIVAWFYGDIRLRNITLVISISFLFSGLTVQHQALLYRQMQLGKLALINIISVFLGSVIGIILAWKGFNYWALVWKEIFTNIFIASGVWLICPWLPGLPKRHANIRPLLSFGRDLTGKNILGYISRRIDKILIGRLNGAISLGLYEKATQLMVLPMQQIRTPLVRVAMPALSALQNDNKKYLEYYKKLNELFAFIYMPMVVYLGLFSENVIRLILGEKWLGTVVIFRILAFASFIFPVSSLCDVVLITRGMTKRYFIWGMVDAFFIISCYVIGVNWGAVGVATAFTIGKYMLFYPSIWYRLKGTNVPIDTPFKSVYLAAFSSLLMGLILFFISKYFIFKSNILIIAISLLFSCIIYLGIWWVIPSCRQKLKEYYSLPRLLFKR